MRGRWNGAASGELAAALKAFGVVQRALARNLSGSNSLDSQCTAGALRSGRTSRTSSAIAISARTLTISSVSEYRMPIRVSSSFSAH